MFIDFFRRCILMYLLLLVMVEFLFFVDVLVCSIFYFYGFIIFLVSFLFSFFIIVVWCYFICFYGKRGNWEGWGSIFRVWERWGGEVFFIVFRIKKVVRRY